MKPAPGHNVPARPVRQCAGVQGVRRPVATVREVDRGGSWRSQAAGDRAQKSPAVSTVCSITMAISFERVIYCHGFRYRSYPRKETIDYLEKGEKVGLLAVHLYRPFSAKATSWLPCQKVQKKLPYLTVPKNRELWANLCIWMSRTATSTRQKNLSSLADATVWVLMTRLRLRFLPFMKIWQWTNLRINSPSESKMILHLLLFQRRRNCSRRRRHVRSKILRFGSWRYSAFSV